MATFKSKYAPGDIVAVEDANGSLALRYGKILRVEFYRYDSLDFRALYVIELFNCDQVIDEVHEDEIKTSLIYKDGEAAPCT